MLRIEDITVRFQSFALEDIHLEVARHDYLALLGVSGAGKTVLLEVLAGLVKPEKGRILVRGHDITGDKVQQRKIGLVYQDQSLFPHLNVFNNMAYPLRNHGIAKQVIKEKVDDLAGTIGVRHLLNRYPGTLSGGEAQRVALARTLAADPDILLLDEPLANLDVKLKSDLRALLRKIHQSGKTIIHVTHDFMEAATLANKVAVVEQGRLIQHGTPEEVFRHPRNEFVARFSGIRNLFRCMVEQENADTGLYKAIVNDSIAIQFIGGNGEKEGYVMVPQEDIIISEEPLASSAVNRLQGEVREAYLSGSGMELVVDAGVEFVVAVSRKSQENMQLIPGKKVWLGFKAAAVKFIKA